VKYGYVFESCTIENLAKNFSLGRSWGGESKLTYLNTIILQPYELIASRFTTAGMNVPAYSFKEFNSVDGDGNMVTPLSNVQTFTKDKQSYTYNTTISADSAQLFTIDKVFPDWAPMTLAQQAVMGTLKLSGTTLSWDAVADAPGYAVFADGRFQGIVSTTTFATDPDVKSYSVRAANLMGGFGTGASVNVATAIGTATENDVVYTEYFSANGMRLNAPQRGVNIRVSSMADGQKVTDKVVLK